MVPLRGEDNKRTLVVVVVTAVVIVPPSWDAHGIYCVARLAGPDLVVIIAMLVALACIKRMSVT